MKRGRRLVKLLAGLLSICLLFISCAPIEVSDEKSTDLKYSQEVQNLEKLCKVWGYTKYYHPAFLFGEKDWDKELLTLIPQVQEAKSDKETNQILYDWFVALGETDFGETRNHQFWKNQDSNKIDIQADISWTKDIKYLGENLSAALQQIEIIPNISNPKNPPVVVSTANSSQSVNFNEKINENFDYSNAADRLSGLFRLWNAIEYYSPYLKLTDEDWHNLLPKYIAKMLQGQDKHSYDLTLASLLSKLRDAHANFKDESYMDEEFGEYYAPVYLETAEGHPVVTNVYGEDCPLQVGDVILKLDGKEIEQAIVERKEYISTPTDDKLLSGGGVYDWLLSSHDPDMEITVFRDGMEQTFSVIGKKEYSGPFTQHYPRADVSHEILEGNIGLINPELLKDNDVDGVIKEFSETDGMIIDLRQYPSYQAAWLIQGEITDEGSKTAYLQLNPVGYYPGAYSVRDFEAGSSLPGYQGKYSDRPVVVIIDEQTMSMPEFFTMIYRTNENVTILGNPSAGCDGERRGFLMPDGNTVYFTVMGILTPDGGQTQRIGLSPDIEVYPTIEGIKEGRDELMEAAVTYIQEQNAK